MDEASLIQQAQQGDLDSYNQLVLIFQDVIYNQAMRMMNEFFDCRRYNPRRVHYRLSKAAHISRRFFSSLAAKNSYKSLL